MNGLWSKIVLVKTGDFLSSPIFCDRVGLKWILLLYPNGVNNDNKEYLSLYIQCKSDNVAISAPHKITCKAEMRYSKYRNVKPTSDGQMFFSHDKNSQCWGFPKFISKNAIEQSRITDINTIECVIEPPEFVLKEKECHSLANNLEQMLESSHFSDVHFTVKGQIFHGHKNILVASSPVFAAMFKHDMVENIKGSVVIEDIEPTVFKEILRFMYSGNVERLEDMVFELAVAADMYRLDGLKVMCEMHLWKTLTKNNAIDVLEYADKYRAAELKKYALEFITAHAADVITMEGSESFRESDLFLECYDFVMKKIKQL